MFVVYKIVNLVNWKVYIGCTSQEPKKRWKQHVYLANRAKKHKLKFYAITRAIEIYGEENFEFKVIRECDSIDAMKEEEIRLITFYDTYGTEWGYNLTKGGDGAVGVKRTIEQRQAMSLARIGKRRGAESPNWGKKASEETLKKQSERMKQSHAAGTFDHVYDMWRKITKEEKIQLRIDYAETDLTGEELGIKYGIAAGTVSLYVRGIKRQAPQLSDIDKTRVIEMKFCDRLTNKEIAKIIGCTVAKVSRTILRYKKANAIPKSKGVPPKRRKPMLSIDLYESMVRMRFEQEMTYKDIGVALNVKWRKIAHLCERYRKEHDLPIIWSKDSVARRTR